MSDLKNTNEHAGQRSSGSRVFLGFLGFVSIFYAVILTYHFAVPRQVEATQTMAFLERCRQICEDYGLVPTGRIDQDARAFLDATDHVRLQGELEQILEDADHKPVASLNHSLLGQPAPLFDLLNVEGQSVSLSKLNSDGPVIVVFYYGYFCSHCVAQLFGLNDDLQYFRQMGATIVAISADSSQTTAERFAEYGSFEFPVLSDPDNSVAELYGVFMPETDEKEADLQHGTFVVDREGTVVWANYGHEPFTDNQTLLKVLRQKSR